jgi:putative Mg2+ transporter-C (MgtC) family protein
MGDISNLDLALRLGLSVALGLILGFEREQRGRAAGMRTTMLVCVASAVVMMLSQHLFWESSLGGGGWHPDPARLAAGVLAGMGFLGAGVIIRQENTIHGVTTAAVLWFSAILGMAFGSGFLLLGFAGFCIVAMALFILPYAESRIPSDRYGHLVVLTQAQGPTQAQVRAAVEALDLGAQLKRSGLEYDKVKRRWLMHFDVKIKNTRFGDAQVESVALVAAMKGVLSVKWS